MLESGQFATIKDLTAAEKINSSYVSRLLRLTLLAPDIVEAVLDGRQPAAMTLPKVMEPFPVDWERQRFHASASLTATLRPAPCERAELSQRTR